jgi:predicted amidohydrolase YtcJ
MRPTIILTITALLTSGLWAELSVKNIEKMVRDIRAKRTSKMREDTNITSPFVTVKQDENATIDLLTKEEEKKEPFVLGAIMNHRAFVNGKWLKVGDELDGFTLKVIAKDHVKFTQKNRSIVVFFRKTKPILTFSKE